MTETLGRYTLHEKIATGGMAEIWLASLPGAGGFSSTCVIKKILPHLAQSEEFVQMFLNEARIASQLHHPNIARIFDLGAERDTYFLAMEYVPGRDLRKLFRDADQAGRPLPPALSLRILIEVGQALAYAHAASDVNGRPLQIIHRDVSPQNVLVTYEGGVKLIDFGIAKAADQLSQTRTGVLKGKYAYMAPEQVEGADVDGRADLFALGIVSFELVTGYRLFKRDSDLGTIRAVQDCLVPTPSSLREDIPPLLDEILLKALSRDPDDRYQSGTDFALALEEFLRSGSYPASPSHLRAFLKQLYPSPSNPGPNPRGLALPASEPQAPPVARSRGRAPASSGSDSLEGVPVHQDARVATGQVQPGPNEPPTISLSAAARPSSFADLPPGAISRAAAERKGASPPTKPMLEPFPLPVPRKSRKSASGSRAPKRARATSSAERRRADPVLADELLDEPGGAATVEVAPASRRPSPRGPIRDPRKLREDDPLADGPPRAAQRPAGAWREALAESELTGATRTPGRFRRTVLRILQGALVVGLAGLGVLALPGLRSAFEKSFAGVVDSEADGGEPADDGPQGQLTVDCSPPAKVMLGGRTLGNTPLVEVDVPVGHQKLRFINDSDGLDREVDAEISAEQTLVLHERFGEGTVELPVPAGHRFTVLYKSQAIGRIPGPAIQLAEGDHNLTLVDEVSGKRETRSVTVMARGPAATPPQAPAPTPVPPSAR